MRDAVKSVIEMVLGAFLLGIGLIYLISQDRATEKLMNTVKEEVVRDNGLYQQYNNTDISQVSDEELQAMIMGYREYPIIIDGNFVAADGNDYIAYFSYIRSGTYKKTYLYDTNHNISQLVFTYSGS